MEVQSERNLRACTRKNYEDNLDDEIEGKRTFSVLDKLIAKRFHESSFVTVLANANDIDLKYVQEHGFEKPFLFETTEGLHMRVPPPEFSVEDVRKLVGSRRIVDVIDVNTQQQIEMSMIQFARYYSNPVREKIYNVISLEFSHTKLESYVESPLLVRQLDWVSNVWPRELILQQTDATNNLDDMKYPKVRKYVLMSVRDSYTDFHIDFCGTSVWYHIIQGKKIFWLIPPTKQNLAIYENWVLSGKQQDVFLGDRVEKCSIVELNVGNTFLMPSGWIHAVYTAEDSLVLGGNFIHTFNVERQFMICDIEERTRVPKKFRYPLYTQMMWYVVQRYVNLLEQDQEERSKLKETTEVTEMNGTNENSEGNKKVVKHQGSEKTKSAKNVEENKENMEHDRAEGKKSVSFPEEMDVHEEEKDETNEKKHEKTARKKPWDPVYLTSFEIEGLLLVIERMRNWPLTNVPENITKPTELLDRLQELLQSQKKYDHALSITGKHFMKQLFGDEDDITRKKTKTIRSKPRKPGSSLRRRRTRCRACESCLREDCGECKLCKDMKKYGGPGRMKQTCLMRQCQNPTLPVCAICDVCETRQPDDEDTLMECSECASIVHPTCLQPEGYYFIVLDVNNCWRCPKCCDEETGEPFLAQKLNAKRPVDQLRPSHAVWAASRASTQNHTTTKPKTLKRKRSIEDKHTTDDEEEELSEIEEEEEDSNDEDSAPLSSLAKKSKKDSSPPPEIPFVPPQEVSPTHIVRPRPVTPPPETLFLDNETSHVLKRTLWLNVFKYLSQNELCTCMCVSRTWNRWCMDKRFWTKIVFPIGRPITASALSGIVRRQPLELHLNNTNITQQQLAWFLSRLPRLRELYLCMSTFATIGAFSRVTCPPIKVLDLSWSEKITDNVIEELLKPATNGRRERLPQPGENSSRFRFLNDLRLSGCEITDACLRSIKRYLCCLSRLDVSYCIQVTDEGVASLMETDSKFHENIKELNFTGCENVTDTCLEALKKAQNLVRIELKKCEKVHQQACSAFLEYRGLKSVILTT